MKKLIVGLIAIGAILALRTAAGRIGQKMREHCTEMAGNCRQMMAGKAGKSGQESGMREHCKEMAEQFGPGQTAEMQEHSEDEAPRLVTRRRSARPDRLPTYRCGRRAKRSGKEHLRWHR